MKILETLQLLLLLLLSLNLNSSKAYDDKRNCFAESEQPSIFYGVSYGRLGNQLLGYALLYQMEKTLGVQSYISLECKEILSRYFTPESIKLPVLQKSFSFSEEIPWEPFNGPLASLLSEPHFRRGKYLYLYPPTSQNPHGYRPEDHLSQLQETFQRNYTKALRRDLFFKAEVMSQVVEALSGVAASLGIKNSQKITYVGIHHRRSDHIEYMNQRHGMKPLKKEYFEDAMKYFRKEYKNVAFIYVSEDMNWGRKFLTNKKKDLFFLGKGESSTEDVDEASVFDFTLLTQCNHTIVSRGTFSMWIALLAGGEYYTEYGPIMAPN